MLETIPQRIKRVAREYRDKIAISQGDFTLKYSELAGEIEQVARELDRAGVKSGSRVLLVLPNNWFALRLILACFELGIVPLPISPRYPEHFIEKIFSFADASLIITWKEKVLNESLPQALLDENGNLTFRSKPLSSGEQLPALESPVAALFATSGTSGVPKLVMLTHHNILSDIDSCFDLVDISPEDKMLGVLPMFHVFGFSIAYLLPLAKGMTLTIVPSLYPLDGLLESLKRYQSTVFLGVPALFSILAGARARQEFDLHPLRLLICGGDALPSRVRENFENAFGLKIIEGYGITEASPVVSVNPSPEARIPGSAGLVIDAIHLRIVDEAGNEVAPGEVGEIVLSGDPISPGYFRNPEENARSFRGGWFYTGDLGRRDEKGVLYIEGRKKELIIVSGFNVYPREVEEVIMEFPGVAQSAVIGVKRDVRGELIKAYVVPAEGATLEPLQIVRFCKQRLPHYKVPRIVEIVKELPQTVTGKIMKYAIKSSGAEVEVKE
ncbi:MAG: long-chain acyl-CoA synthetase [Candidatus Atribacteria bacterium]|nr:long-chain acyl-CoA synthetase [Candidatus Atribacteria bacterium]